MKMPWWIDDIVTPLASIVVSVCLIVEMILYAVNGKQTHFQWAVILALLLIMEDVKK